MATINDTAKYILEKCGSLNPYKLQQDLYYCQGWHLARHNVPLFPEDFEARAICPICPVIHDEYVTCFNLTEEDIGEGESKNLTEQEKATIDAVVDDFGDYFMERIPRNTYIEDPWQQTRHYAPRWEDSHEIIPKEAMKKYFSSLVNVSIYDVAKYILGEVGRTPVNDIQWYCYFAQAWYLASYKQPLFREDFYRWATGPVNPEFADLFQDHDDLVAYDITGGDPNRLSEEQKETIRDVIKYYYGTLGNPGIWYEPMYYLPRCPEDGSTPVILKGIMARQFAKHLYHPS